MAAKAHRLLARHVRVQAQPFELGNPRGELITIGRIVEWVGPIECAVVAYFRTKDKTRERLGRGRFDIELVGPGFYEAEVSLDGYAWIWGSKTRVEGGAATLQLKAVMGGSCSGVVVGADGKPLSGAKVAAASEPPTPAVAIKKSITPDYIVCLEDGKKLKMLKRHLRSTYNMTPDEYRVKWGLPPDYPMVAPNYAAARSQLAKQMGLGQQRRRRRERG